MHSHLKAVSQGRCYDMRTEPLGEKQLHRAAGPPCTVSVRHQSQRQQYWGALLKYVIIYYHAEYVGTRGEGGAGPYANTSICCCTSGVLILCGKGTTYCRLGGVCASNSFSSWQRRQGAHTHITATSHGYSPFCIQQEYPNYDGVDNNETVTQRTTPTSMPSLFFSRLLRERCA